MERVGPDGFASDGSIRPFFDGEEGMVADDLPESEGVPTLPSLDLDKGIPSHPHGDFGPPALAGFTSGMTPGVDFSGTNVQVEGVDEADIVKTDGSRIIGLARNESHYRVRDSQIWIADTTTPRFRGQLTLSDGYYSELYLDGDRVFVIGRSTVGIDPPGSSGTSERPARAVVITEVDISDIQNPRVVRHLRVEGSYVSSRAANGYARVVISSPHGLGFVRPSYGSGSASSEDSAERFNRLIVQESGVEQWLPNYNLHSSDGESISRGHLIDCDRVFAPSEFSGFNQVSVLSFATGESLELRDAVSTMADGETVYASPGNLYVSRVVYDYDPDSNRRKAETVIHKFSLDSSGSADYEASGTAIGSPINQYAFHEYEGRLFVATTSDQRGRDSESFVTVLEDEGGALKQVGQVGNLGRNEDIYAVRYIGDKAYVVTFRRTDPLYVIDLSDPTDPTTEGELKITGFSAYLHPVGEDLLLGVGREATTRGIITGAKVSLFDVSDPSDPRTLDTLVLEGGYSEVEWDARAFLWWEPQKLAVVPIDIRRNDYYGALALRVNIDADSPEIELISRISHGSTPRPTGDPKGCEWYDVPSVSLGWTAQSLSSVSVVKVCPASSENEPAWQGAPYRYACSQPSKPGIEDQEDGTLATLDEILEEVRAANRESDAARDLPDLLSRLQSSFVEEADQVTVCVLNDFDHISSEEILRSIVIGNNLWTLSGSYLQANDLYSLRSYSRLRLPPLPRADQNPDSETAELETDSGASGSAAAQATGTSLSSFDECGALMDFIREEALKLVGPYGIDKRGNTYYSEASFYDTDGPVEDPDEADMVKTDGRRIVGLDNFDLSSELWVVEASVSPRKIAGRLLLSNGFYQRLYLAGDRVFVLGRSGVGIDPPEGEGVIPERTAEGDLARPDAWMDSDAVVITEVDISDAENPEAVRHLRVEGRYVGSRVAEGFVRLVIDSPRERLSFVAPRSDLPRPGNTLALAERFNRQLIRESTLEQWLPNYNLHSADGQSINRGQLLDCDKVYAPNKVSSFDQLSVLSFALDQNLGVGDAVSLVTDEEGVYVSPDDRYAGKVYVSPSNLYAGRAVYDGGDGLEGGEPATVIHKFSLNSSGGVGYEASGKIYGHPSYNAFYEYDGRLFAITSSEEDSESFMTVLEEEGETLNQVGQASDIGRGKQVESMRYFVDKAYVKTGSIYDPIYVMDLSDPTNPIAEGELDISANSPYLKPVGENLLLAVGYEISELGESGRLKVSLYDVSDPANPRTLETLVLGDLFLNRDAFNSFLWWAPEKMLFVPIGAWNGDHLAALRVNIDSDSPKIEFISRIFHDLYFLPEGDAGGCEWYEAPSVSLAWTAEYLSTMSIVSVCPHSPDGDYSGNEPEFHECQAGIPSRRTEDQEAPENAALDEIIEEVRLATNRSGSEDLLDLLARLLSSSVKDARQVRICPVSDRYLGILEREREISHSMVVNDNLWTLSRGYLQVNDLEFLDRIAWLETPSKPDRW